MAVASSISWRAQSSWSSQQCLVTTPAAAQPSRCRHLPHSSCSSHSKRPLRAVAAADTLIAQKPKLSYVGVNAALQTEGICSDKALFGLQQFGDTLPPPPAISKTDEEFLAMGLEFVESRDGIKVTELNELFEKVGFPRRDPERLKVALANTHRMIWIRSLKQSRVSRLGQLLGFARATSDGAFSATIWDVAVSPAWQRSGLGRAMIERLTNQLVQDGISTITLYAEPQVVGLYKKLGFVDDPQGIRGMAFQRKRKEKKGLF